jgi:hypothetical protein
MDSTLPAPHATAPWMNKVNPVLASLLSVPAVHLLYELDS